MKRLLLLLVMLPIIAQGQAIYSDSTDIYIPQIRSLIDVPTAGLLNRGEYDFEMRVFPQGGILAGFSVGLFDRFNLGVYYGGTEIIGNSSEIGWNNDPGVLVKYRLFDESTRFPAVALGYSNQGYGSFCENDSTGDERFLIKSRGLYLVGSKNFLYAPGRTYSVHLGVNYNTSERADDESMNFFGGLDFVLNPELSVMLEYDFALDDNNNISFGEGKGYLNGAVRWTFARFLLFQVNFKDLLGNYRDSATVNREIKIVYTTRI